MRYIQPHEAARLLEAVIRITDVYYNTPRSAKTKKDYTSLLEASLVEISDIALTAIDEVYDVMETETPHQS
jgi:hypothetical protein